MTPEQIAAARALVDAATQGRAVQFHPHYCPEAKGAKVEDWDTSHDLSVIRDDGSRYKIGSFRHAADAMFDQWCRHKVPAILDALAAAEARAADLTAKLEAVTDAIDGIYVYANDTMGGPSAGPDDRAWYLDGVVEIRDRAMAFATSLGVVPPALKAGGAA